MHTKTTYFSELKSVLDISSPIIDNNTGMRYRGYFAPDWREEDVEFDAVYYGLKKRRQDRGIIYCENASNLFSTANGQVDLVFKLDQDINNGVLEELAGSTAYLSSLVIWGINIGQYEVVQPTINAKFTKDGIKFEFWTSEARFSLTDTTTTVLAGETISMRFAWDRNGMDGFDGFPGVTSYYNCNGTEIISDVPISTESISGLNFCIGNTPSFNSNLPMTIGRVTIYDGISLDAEEQLYASSSSSSYSSLSSPTSSSSSLEYSSSSSLDSSSSSLEYSSSSSSFGYSTSSSSSSIDSTSSSSLDSSSSSLEYSSSSSSSLEYSSSSLSSGSSSSLSSDSSRSSYSSGSTPSSDSTSSSSIDSPSSSSGLEYIETNDFTFSLFSEHFRHVVRFQGFANSPENPKPFTLTRAVGMPESSNLYTIGLNFTGHQDFRVYNTPELTSLLPLLPPDEPGFDPVNITLDEGFYLQGLNIGYEGKVYCGFGQVKSDQTFTIWPGECPLGAREGGEGIQAVGTYNRYLSPTPSGRNHFPASYVRLDSFV